MKHARTVDAVFDAYPKPLKAKLLALRRLILKTAAATKGVGELEETLKWGQPSYLTSETKSGSTIRIDRAKSSQDQVAIYFHCQTDLVETFRELYPNKLTYQGNRKHHPERRRQTSRSCAASLCGASAALSFAEAQARADNIAANVRRQARKHQQDSLPRQIPRIAPAATRQSPHWAARG